MDILPSISSWIIGAASSLRGVSGSPHLDAELILGLVTKRSREKLLTGGNDRLSFFQLIRANYYLHLRRRLIPVAYITRRKKFFGLSFYVNKHVLIPRPETETLVAMALDYARKLPHTPNIIDVGTGSGCIGLSLAHSLDPKPNLTLSDISARALLVSRKNARRLKLPKVKFIKRSLLSRIDIKSTDIILANLPYVNSKWNFLSKDIKHEPRHALFAHDNGLALIKKLLNQIAKKSRKKPLAIFLEADPSQMKDIKNFTLELFPNSKIKINGFAIRIILSWRYNRE